MKEDTPQATHNSFKTYAQIAVSFSVAKLGLLAVKHPVRVIETNKQASPKSSNAQIIKQIYTAHGLRGFYLSTPASIFRILLTESYRGPLMMSVPEYIRHLLKKNAIGNEQILTPLIATPIISVIDAAITCPILRMSTHQLTTDKKISLIEIANNYYKRNSIKQFYRGYGALFIQTTNSWGTFFLFDDLSKFLLKEYFGGVSNSALTVSSVIGGGLQTIINVGPDTLRVQMQKADNTSLNLRQTMTILIKTNGVKALFSALPHKLLGGIIGYGYKSFLREYWTPVKAPDPSKKSTWTPTMFSTNPQENTALIPENSEVNRNTNTPR